MQREKGDESLRKALAGPLHESKLASFFAEAAQLVKHDLVIVSGVGSVWPLMLDIAFTVVDNAYPVIVPQGLSYA